MLRILYLLSVMLVGCGTLEAGSVTVLAVRPTGLWIAREGKAERNGTMMRMRVVYYCTDPRPGDHPICRSAWHTHSESQIEAIWPSGVGIGK